MAFTGSHWSIYIWNPSQTGAQKKMFFEPATTVGEKKKCASSPIFFSWSTVFNDDDYYTQWLYVAMLFTDRTSIHRKWLYLTISPHGTRGQGDRQGIRSARLCWHVPRRVCCARFIDFTSPSLSSAPHTHIHGLGRVEERYYMLCGMEEWECVPRHQKKTWT